jgi:glycosyltransferase involved in cell wall biosynthesis
MRVGINASYMKNGKTGVGRYLENILWQWTTLETKHELFLYYHDNEDIGEVDRQILASDAYTSKLVKLPLGPFAKYRWFLFTLPRQLRRDGVDLYYTADYFISPFLHKAIHRAFVLHDIAFVTHPEWFSSARRLIHWLFTSRRINKVDRIFTSSEYSADEIAGHYGIERAKITVALCGIDESFLTEPSSDTATSPIVPKGDDYFFYVGEMFNRRHIPEMLRAFGRFLSATGDTRTRFLLRGSNQTVPFVDIQAIANEVNKQAGRDAVQLLPRLSDRDLKDLYRHARAVNYMSTYKGFGFPVLEDVASGTPVATCRETSLPEVGGELATYVNPADEQDIVSSMEKLVGYKSGTEYDSTVYRDHARAFRWRNSAEIVMTALGRHDSETG